MRRWGSVRAELGMGKGRGVPAQQSGRKLTMFFFPDLVNPSFLASVTIGKGRAGAGGPCGWSGSGGFSSGGTTSSKTKVLSRPAGNFSSKLFARPHNSWKYSLTHTPISSQMSSGHFVQEMFLDFSEIYGWKIPTCVPLGKVASTDRSAGVTVSVSDSRFPIPIKVQ